MGFFKKNKAFYKESFKPCETDLLSHDFLENIEILESSFNHSSDLTVKVINLPAFKNRKLGILYLNGMVDTNIQEKLLHAILDQETEEKQNDTDFLGLLLEQIVTVTDVERVEHYKDIKSNILNGNTVYLIEGTMTAFAGDTQGYKNRDVQESTSQTVVRGPRESFTEDIRTNITQIRKRIKDTALVMENMKIGRVTNTDVSIMYVKGICDEIVLKEVKKRLKAIDVDGILESGYVEEFIQDANYTPFPTVFNTERPDAVAGALLEGRVAILIDGTPFVLVVPALFIHFYQVPEDYYQRSDISTLLRILRLFCFIIALFGPSLYIGITTFHMEMLPTTLLISLAAQREGIPFPAFFEAMIMEITFEILREAGVRMPRNVGQAVSIVGALVIGEAAIMAGIVSASMVIVVAITAIASFVIPSYNMAISLRILRFIFMILAATFGLLGITVGIFLLVFHLSSLRSFGIPYMTPFGPFFLKDQKDTIFRFPRWGLISRPKLMATQNQIRVSNDKRGKT